MAAVTTTTTVITMMMMMMMINLGKTHFNFFNNWLDFNFNLYDKSLMAVITKLSRSSDLNLRLEGE